MQTTRAQNIRMLLVQHVARDCTTKSPLEGCRGFRTEKETGRRSRGAPDNQAAKSGSSRNHGYQRRCPAMGRLRIGFLRGRDPSQPKTYTMICGLSRKRKTQEPSTGTQVKKPRKDIHGTRPIITMILHQGEEKHQIQVLLDTGCSIALLNSRTVEKLGIKKKEYRQTHSIKNYTGESVKGAGQFYMEPMLLQHRNDYSREKFEILPMEPNIDVFLPFDWITAHPL